MRKKIGTILVVMLLCGSFPAQGFEVFQDPNNAGTNPGAPQSVPGDGTPVALNLYVLHGTTLSDANDVCSGTGLGDEFCGWDTWIAATGDMALVSFDPNGDVVSNEGTAEFSAGTFRANGGDPINGQVGAHRWGTLTVSCSSATGSLDVTGNLWVNAALGTDTVPANPLAVCTSVDPCADLGGDWDGDTICDDGDDSGTIGDGPCTGGATTNCDDNCRYKANPGQEDDGGLATTTPDGIGTACQCGDVNQNGVTDSVDGTLIKRAALGLPPYTSPAALPCPDCCDVNANATCDSVDGTLIKRNALGLPPATVQNQACPAANP